MKSQLKKEAIRLRKEGLTYNEILQKLPVAKSTISLWLRSVGLATPQKQRMTKRRMAAMKRGWDACRRIRIQREIMIKNQALEEIKHIEINNNNLWLMGMMLYWAEGAKSKEYRVSQRVSFSNQDPLMIKLFLLWLKKCLHVKSDQIVFNIYIHENYKPIVKNVANY